MALCPHIFDHQKKVSGATLLKASEFDLLQNVSKQNGTELRTILMRRSRGIEGKHNAVESDIADSGACVQNENNL